MRHINFHFFIIFITIFFLSLFLQWLFCVFSIGSTVASSFITHIVAKILFFIATVTFNNLLLLLLIVLLLIIMLVAYCYLLLRLFIWSTSIGTTLFALASFRYLRIIVLLILLLLLLQLLLLHYLLLLSHYLLGSFLIQFFSQAFALFILLIVFIIHFSYFHSLLLQLLKVGSWVGPFRS